MLMCEINGLDGFKWFISIRTSIALEMYEMIASLLCATFTTFFDALFLT